MCNKAGFKGGGAGLPPTGASHQTPQFSANDRWYLPCYANTGL